MNRLVIGVVIVVMHKVILKEDIDIKKDGFINYVVKQGKVQSHRQWLMGMFAFAYDAIMKKSVIPNKLAADIALHRKKNQEILTDLKKKKILELGTGSGGICSYIDPSNDYVGIDISKGLLKKAGKRFQKRGNNHFELFLASADDLPFSTDSFDFVFCNLSFNFFQDAQRVVKEIKRVMKNEGQFFCSVPVPEKNNNGNQINGTLRSAKEMKHLFEINDFNFKELPPHNGAIFYFLASKMS